MYLYILWLYFLLILSLKRNEYHEIALNNTHVNIHIYEKEIREFFFE